MRSAGHRRHGRQRGVAAVEFAFVLTGLLALFHGIATFGSIFYTQQAVARAAEDGARALVLMPGGAADEQRVRDVVHDALAASLVVPASVPSTFADRRTWVAAHVQVALTVAGGNATVTVSHRYGDNPLMPLAAIVPWLPDLMTHRATLARPA